MRRLALCLYRLPEDAKRGRPPLWPLTLAGRPMGGRGREGGFASLVALSSSLASFSISSSSLFFLICLQLANGDATQRFRQHRPHHQHQKELY